MDQGLSAVLGATVGVLGTLGTASLTYAAARHQVRDQSRVDHRRLLREERQAAYLELISAHEELEIESSKAWGALAEHNPDYTAEHGLASQRKVGDLLNSVYAKTSRVELVGPREVARSARVLRRAGMDQHLHLVKGLDENVRDMSSLARKYNNAYSNRTSLLDAFIEKVREVLEKDPY